MKIVFRVLLLLLTVSVVAGAAEKSDLPVSPWERSIVKIEVTRKDYDYYQPWNQRDKQTQKVGLVTGSKEILTPAEFLSNQTLLRVQKNGRGKWWIGKLVWVDYPANLAVVTVEEEDFWKDLKPVKLSGKIPENEPLQLIKWNDGVLETRKAAFMRYVVEESETSGISYALLKANVDLQGSGWGEPLVSGSQVVGITISQDKNICNVIPASFIEFILAGHRGKYRGLGYFHFYWQPAENTTSLEYLGEKDEDPRGVLIIKVPDRQDGVAAVLKAHDVILQIGGFDIDIQGDYRDPEFGHLMLENLAVRQKWAGDEVPMKILREGKELSVTYTLPHYEYTNSLVAYASYDQPPEYFIVGGLVFQPLTRFYLKEWGADWKTRAPFRLNYYTSDAAEKDQPALIILSQVLPDPYNIGYQEQRYLAVKKVNGQRVGSLSDLRAALQKPVDGFHTIDFTLGDSLQRVVLAAGDAERQATTRVLERYGVPEEFHINSAAEEKLSQGK